MTEAPEKLTEEQFNVLRQIAKRIIWNAFTLRIFSFGQMNQEELRERERQIHSVNEVNPEGRYKMVNYITPSNMGPTEREFFGQITALGIRVLGIIEGRKHPGDAAKPEAIVAFCKKPTTPLSPCAPDLIILYNQLNNDITCFKQYFPPVERGGPGR